MITSSDWFSAMYKILHQHLMHLGASPKLAIIFQQHFLGPTMSREGNCVAL